jgi:hypothetical protein
MLKCKHWFKYLDAYLLLLLSHMHMHACTHTHTLWSEQYCHVNKLKTLTHDNTTVYIESCTQVLLKPSSSEKFLLEENHDIEGRTAEKGSWFYCCAVWNVATLVVGKSSMSGCFKNEWSLPCKHSYNEEIRTTCKLFKMFLMPPDAEKGATKETSSHLLISVQHILQTQLLSTTLKWCISCEMHSHL